MEPINRLVAGIKVVDELLAEKLLEPDVQRTDWGLIRARLNLVSRSIQDEVLGPLEQVRFGADEDLEKGLGDAVADRLARAAVLMSSAGDAPQARSLLDRAASLTTEPSLRAELEAGVAPPTAYATLGHGRWLVARGEQKRAEATLRRVATETADPVLRQAAKRARQKPSPAAPPPSAPPLFQLNGCGTALVGERDLRPDGWYVATYCVTVLWVPVLPLAAYRVRRVDASSYQIAAREQLSPAVRSWRAIALVGALAVGGWLGVTQWLESPSHRVAVAIEEAQVLEAAGDREQAIGRYQSTVHELVDIADVSPAAEAVVRLLAAGVPEPCTPESVDRISGVVNGFYSLPGAARAGAASRLLTTRLAAWAAQLGDATPEQSEAMLVLLDIASKVAEGASGAAIEAQRDSVRRALADRIATERPLAALRHYTLLGDRPSLDAAQRLLESLGDAPSLWLDAEPEVARWMKAASAAGRSSDVESMNRRLERARADHEQRRAVIESGDEKSIEQALREHPDDQELTVALASLVRDRGDVRGALSVLGRLGSPAKMTSGARQLLARCQLDVDDAAAADATLTALVDERLPAFLQARRELVAASQASEARVLSELRSGKAPEELGRRYDAASESEKRGIVAAYIDEQLRIDPTLTGPREAYLRQSAIVPACVALGTARLRRAGAASGDGRKQLLERAERAFLAIRGEAEGEPTFHLGLGQVYHRLGRVADGERELKGVLDRNEPGLSLAVASIYRELGLSVRARQVAEAVYASAPESEQKQAAASLVGHIVVDPDEKRQWFERADTKSPDVGIMLVTLGAERLARDGKTTEADRELAKVVSHYERAAERNATSANNAAVAWQRRFDVTGQVASQESAVVHLERAARLQGDGAIVLANLSYSLSRLAMLKAAGKWVHTSDFALRRPELIFGALIESSLRDQALLAVRAQASYRRWLEVSRQEQALAPGNPQSYAADLTSGYWNRDETTLRALATRLEQLPPFSGEDLEESKRAAEAAERSGAEKKAAATSVTRAEQSVARAEKGGHPPTIAAALLQLSDALYDALVADVDGASTSAMVDTARRAVETWPEGIPDSQLVDALFAAAVFEAIKASPAARRSWAAERRTYKLPMWAHVASAGESGAEVAAAIRARPELRDAIAHIVKQRGNRPRLRDWLIASVAADAAALQATEKAFDQADTGLLMQIHARIAPTDRNARAWHELFRGRGTGAIDKDVGTSL